MDCDLIYLKTLYIDFRNSNQVMGQCVNLQVFQDLLYDLVTKLDDQNNCN